MANKKKEEKKSPEWEKLYELIMKTAGKSSSK